MRASRGLAPLPLAFTLVVIACLLLRPAFYQTLFLQKQSVEELQRELMTTSMELQSAREAAALQGKINEAKVCRLQARLDAARIERDEARIKCGKLQDCLLDLSNSPPGAQESPCNLLQSSLSFSPAQHSYHSPASPSIDVISFQGLKRKTREGVDEGVLVFGDDASAKLLLHQARDVEDISALEVHPDPSAITLEDSQQQFSMDILNDDVAIDEDESLDLSELQVEQPSKPTWGGRLSSWDAHTLGRHTPCVSSAASQSWGAIESPKATATPCNPKITALTKHTFTPQLSHSPLPMASPSNAVIPDISGLGNKASLLLVGTMQQQETRLLETTNAGPDNALPEKGKLLLAVIQAGPLLQNLFLAGPLPQWRCPPPQLTALDISRVPMDLCSFLPTPSFSTSAYHVPVMQSPFLTHTMPLGHANSAHFSDHRGLLVDSSELQSNAVKNENNLSVEGRKVRKLCPIGVK